MVRLVEVKQIEGIEYRLEGLRDIQVLRILKALEAINTPSKGFCIELQVMIDAIKQDINTINTSRIKGGIIDREAGKNV